MKSFSDLRNIVSAGGSVIIDADRYSFSDLRNIAAAGANSGGKLFLKSSNNKSFSDLRNIAAANPGNVIFDLSE